MHTSDVGLFAERRIVGDARQEAPTMLGKTILVLGVGLTLVKLFFKPQWHALKARLDRAVNILLVALAISYAVQLLWRYWPAK
jgi:hypothetical protein